MRRKQVMKYRSEIDGLRALAVVPVILFHAGFKAFSGGFVGVDVFFVISGYLITTILLNELEAGNFSIVRFYERRARRILPALFFIMFLCLPFAWFWLLPQDMKSFSQSLVAVSVFASNILFWRTSGYFDTATELKPLIHTWSLSVEEQYYVLFPLFLLVAWKLGRRWIAVLLFTIAVISLALAQYFSTRSPSAAFYLLPTRAWELMIGALVAFYYTEHNIKKHRHSFSQIFSLIGLALITYAIVAYNNQTPFPSIYALAPTLGAALIIVFSTKDTLVGKLLSSKLFVGVGLISYSAYLWHQPMFAFARHRSLDEPSLWLMCALAIAALPLSYLTWRFVERPFRNKHTFNRKQVFIFAFIGSFMFGGVGLIGHITNGSPNRFQFAINYPDMTLFEDQVKECWLDIKKNPSIDSGCKIGARNEDAKFAVIGDSHAGALLYGLDLEAKRNNLSGLSYTYRSCPPLKNTDPLKITDDDFICLKFRNSFFSSLSLNNHIPEIIVINARWALLMEKKRYQNNKGVVEPGDDWIWDLDPASYRESMAKSIADSIKDILANGKKVILIYPVPEMAWDVPSRLRKVQLYNGAVNPEDASITQESFQKRTRSAYDALDSIGDYKNLIRIKPENLFCTNHSSSICIAHLDGKPLYFDDDHLSNLGSNLISKEILNQILSLLQSKPTVPQP